MKRSHRSKPSFFVDPVNSPKFSQIQGLETKVLTGLEGEKMMMVQSSTLPGHTVPIHTHPHEQIGMVYSGKAVLRIGDEGKLVKEGDFYCIPSNVPHGDTCVGNEPFVMLDIFYPVREDFIEKLARQSKKTSKREG